VRQRAESTKNEPNFATNEILVQVVFLYRKFAAFRSRTGWYKKAANAHQHWVCATNPGERAFSATSFVQRPSVHRKALPGGVLAAARVARELGATERLAFRFE
jgi:hypothetical protein